MKFLGFVVTALMLVVASNAVAGDLVLKAPTHSEDGSYILQLETSKSRHFDSLELYRSVNGSEYKLLVTVPLFKAISQMVNQNGIYGYKIRGIASDGSSEISEPVFVEVASKRIKQQMLLQQAETNKAREREELTLGAR